MKNRFVVRVALFLLAMMGVVSGLSPIFVYADNTATNPAITITNVSPGDGTATSGRIKTTCTSINETLREKKLIGDKEEFLTYSYDSASLSCSITINMVQYRKLSNQIQQTFMQVALDGIYNSDISRTAKNKIYNELCALDETTAALVRELSSDVRADFYKAYSWFKPWSGPLGILLGVIALAMFVLLGLTAVVDISYITIPLVQLWLTDEKNNKAKFVSHEAYSAVKEQQSKAGTEYVSPIMVYMKHKVKQYIAIFICLLYLCSGQIYVLLSNMMSYFSGLLG